MACINRLSFGSNEQHQGICNVSNSSNNNNNNALGMGPRISFSSDFVDNKQSIVKPEFSNSGYREAPVSSDFKFSVSGYTMIPADELFSKGKILPLKESSKTTTLREELLVDDDCDDVVFLPSRLPMNSIRWKERFRAHIFPKKADHDKPGALVQEAAAVYASSKMTGAP